jgi:hypothetical protein
MRLLRGNSPQFSNGFVIPSGGGSGDLVVDPGVQSFLDTSGFTTLYSGAGSDDASYTFTIPFNFNFSGTDYGLNQNGGVFLGTNGYITFSTSQTGINLSPPRTFPILHFCSSDKIMFEGKAGNGPTVKGKSSFVVYYSGRSYSSAAQLFEAQIIFYSDGKIQLNSKITVTFEFYIGLVGPYMANASSIDPAITLPFTSSTPTFSSFALAGDINGENWTSQSGYWS